MENLENLESLEGRIAYLPDDEKVEIESVENGFATCVRLEGERKGMVAVCSVKSLRLEE